MPVLALAVYAVFSIWVFVTFDFREHPIRGDMSNHILQALSLGYDGDLKYDEQDMAHWAGLDWLPNPDGLIFQAYSGGYAFAKPYGYSLVLAPFVRLFGARGCILTNLLLFGLLNILSFGILRRAYERNMAALLTFVFTFASCAYMYVFYVHSDLFLAVLMAAWAYGLVMMEARPRPAYLVALGLLTGFIVSEKLPAVLIVAPLFTYVAFQRRMKWALWLPAVAFLVACLPYLHYSDWQSWTPYGGRRFASAFGVPFSSPAAEAGYRARDTARFFTTEYVLGMLTDWAGWREKVVSTYYYLVGARTGVLVFFPLLFITLVLSLVRAVRSRATQRDLLLAGIAAYVLFFTVLFTRNYYGGEDSLGNRYFLQIAPVILVLLASLRLAPRGVHRLAICSAALSLAFLYHHHLRPQEAYVRYQELGRIQRLMSYEVNQVGLLQVVPNLTCVNASLYPAFPQYYVYAGIADISGKRLAFMCDGKNVLQKKPDDVRVLGTVSSTFIGKTELHLGRGFYPPEEKLVWAAEHAVLLVENTGREQTLVVSPGLVSNTTVTVRFGGAQVKAEAPFAFSVDTANFEEAWVGVSFIADRSEIPERTRVRDPRRLAFAVILDERAARYALQSGLVRRASPSADAD